MMHRFTAVSPRLLSRLTRQHTGAGVRIPATRCAAQLLRPTGHAVVLRLYSGKPPSQPAKVAEAVSKRQAGAAAKAQAKAAPEIPERLLIYHAGTGRTTFLAMLKVTTLFIGAFFCCVAVPSYIQADKPIEETAKIALCGVVPFLFVTYTTAPFVTHMHMHLPPAARASRAALERFVGTAALGPSTPVTVTTMSVIGKPRYSTLQAGDFVPARRRGGLVNYTRDAARENASRRWYELRAVSSFHVPDVAKASKVKRGNRNLVEPWVWDAVKEKIAKRNAPS